MVVFYGISIVVGYLMQNPVSIHLILNEYFVDNILKPHRAIKRFSVLILKQIELFRLISSINSSISPIDESLAGIIIREQSGLRRGGNERVLHSPQIYRIGARLNWYTTFPNAPGLENHHQIVWCHIQDTRSGRGSYHFAEMKSMNSTTPANWASQVFELATLKYFVLRVKLSLLLSWVIKLISLICATHLLGILNVTCNF